MMRSMTPVAMMDKYYRQDRPLEYVRFRCNDALAPLGSRDTSDSTARLFTQNGRLAGAVEFVLTE